MEKEIRDFLRLDEKDFLAIKKVGYDNYRVNIYQKFTIEESVIQKTILKSSYYLNIKNGIIKDLTIWECYYF